jgi:hypothetical protein
MKDAVARRARRWTVLAVGALSIGLAWPTSAAGQTVSGHARAVQATVTALLGTTTTMLADTGTLGGSSDAREASQSTGSVPSLLSGDTLHATTIGWPDQVSSEASIANLALSIAGTTVGADFVMSRAMAVQGAGGAGSVSIDGLSVNGVPIAVTGEPNQTVVVPGALVVINEQQSSASGTVVNALHIVVDSVADVVIASATAGVQ